MQVVLSAEKVRTRRISRNRWKRAATRTPHHERPYKESENEGMWAEEDNDGGTLGSEDVAVAVSLGNKRKVEDTAGVALLNTTFEHVSGVH